MYIKKLHYYQKASCVKNFLRIFTSNSDIFNQIKKDETDPMSK